jgi:hypothetical protein
LVSCESMLADTEIRLISEKCQPVTQKA